MPSSIRATLNEPIITVENVTKVYKTAGKFFRAVDQATFTVGRGEIFGFIGPNGAGKTTLLQMISTLTEPDAGEVTVCGFNVIDKPREVRNCIGYMPDYVGMYDSVQVWEYLEFFAAAYRLRGARMKKVVEDVMELTDLTGVREKLVSTLSKGMRQRVVLAKTLLHDPQILVLDEPAAGLDPRARIELRVLVKELQRMGKTIMLSSHILTELSDMCDAVGIIEQGRMVAHGRVQDILNKRTLGLNIRLRVLGSTDLAANSLRVLGQIREVSTEAQEVRFIFDAREEDIPALLRKLLELGIPVVEVRQDHRNLEDIFLTLTRGAVA